MKYDEVIECQGVKIPFVPEIITPKIERPMRNNRYEGGECGALREVLRPGDRVLELGAGIGLCSTIAGLVPGVESVVAVEANPDLVPLINETHRINDVENVVVLNGVVRNGDAGEVEFYIRQDFWASSIEPYSRDYFRKAMLTSYNIHALVEEEKPTVIVCDIEGGELGLLDDVDLTGVRSIILETHPKVYGAEGMIRISGMLAAKGFRLAAGTESSSVKLFELVEGSIRPGTGSMMPERRYRQWPEPCARNLIVTCMKDEGPFVLEWLAWHRAIGVTDFVIYTNDCTDGTTDLLNRLDDLGELRHIPNPALATRAENMQPLALRYSHHLREFAEVDYVISMDVDEFINVRVGNGGLDDLYQAAGPFDVLSMTELNHGSNGHKRFKPGWVTDDFPGHESETPGKQRAPHGVKSIVRLSERVREVRNHRPDFVEEANSVLWLNGSGNYTSEFLDDSSRNGLDCRGTYDLVSLDHYPLRSLESYLIKMSRGDVVVAKKQVSRAYWRKRNRHAEFTSQYKKQSAFAKEYYNECFKTDKELMSLHMVCCDMHKTKAKLLQQDPHFVERRDWILREAWR